MNPIIFLPERIYLFGKCQRQRQNENLGILMSSGMRTGVTNTETRAAKKAGLMPPYNFRFNIGPGELGVPDSL